MAVLSTENLCKNFGGLQAVDHVDFSVDTDELKAIIGPNGAGKSTFFKMITGDLVPSSGKVYFMGKDITGWPANEISQMGVAMSWQITNIFPMLSIFENVRVAAQSRRTTYNFWSRTGKLRKAAERAERCLEMVHLLDKRDEIAANLSHGEQRNLEIGIALGTEPKLLLLDEPTAGMSPGETGMTMNLIKNIGKGLAVVLVEHKMSVVMNIAESVTVMHQGAVLAEGTPEQIRSNAKVQEVYLGGSI